MDWNDARSTMFTYWMASSMGLEGEGEEEEEEDDDDDDDFA